MKLKLLYEDLTKNYYVWDSAYGSKWPGKNKSYLITAINEHDAREKGGRLLAYALRNKGTFQGKPLIKQPRTQPNRDAKHFEYWSYIQDATTINDPKYVATSPSQNFGQTKGKAFPKDKQGRPMQYEIKRGSAMDRLKGNNK